MKELPILFTTEDVKAILDGRKTQTRRVIKPQLPNDWSIQRLIQTDDGFILQGRLATINSPLDIKSPYQVGNLLWVKEAYVLTTFPGNVVYRADYKDRRGDFWDSIAIDPKGVKWISPRFMPKKYARIWLEIIGGRAERLQDISEEDIKAEGLDFYENCGWCGGVGYVYVDTGNELAGYDYRQICPCLEGQFRLLWDSINGKKYPWESNPRVWVYEFRRHDENI